MKRPLLFLDIEVGPNFFLVGMMDEDGNISTVDCYGAYDNFLTDAAINELERFFNKYTLITFNGIKYDMPMIYAAMDKRTLKELFEMSSDIVSNNLQPYASMRDYGIPLPTHIDVDHIDISEPAPGVFVSLKKYGTRIHSKTIQDLPYAYDQPLNQSEYKELVAYNVNDLMTTRDLYNAIEDRIELRRAMSKQYGVNLMSKSDAQIAETVIVHELAKVNVKASKGKVLPSIKYDAPDCIVFEMKQLQDVLHRLTHTKFKINKKNGKPIRLEKNDGWDKDNIFVTIGNTTYKLVLGGLHSTEDSLSVEPEEGYTMRNSDVTSYYPSMIIEFGFYPERLTEKFIDVYDDIKTVRLAAKARGDMVVSDSLKIVLNSSFGKMGNMYSKLYAPKLMLQITITGQMLLLMLIERLEAAGFRVVSSNTDGIEYICAIDRIAEAEALIFDWELETGMDMEHDTYKALYARDVNAYVAVHDDDVKARGVYAKPTLKKDSEYKIVFDAIKLFLLDGTPLEETIRACDDVRQFVLARVVKYGGSWKGKFLGKTVRFYYASDGDAIHYTNTHGNQARVAKTEGCRPLMTLPDENKIPDDLDFDRYIEIAYKHLKDLGV